MADKEQNAATLLRPVLHLPAACSCQLDVSPAGDCWLDRQAKRSLGKGPYLVCSSSDEMSADLKYRGGAGGGGRELWGGWNSRVGRRKT